MRTKEKVYEDCTLKNLGNKPNGTRMDIVYDSMEEYAIEYHHTKVLELNKCAVSRSFRLTPSEQSAFDKSGSKSVRFDIGCGGIGTGVSYLNDKGKWIDITDYDSW